jgi:hypothetical protein
MPVQSVPLLVRCTGDKFSDESSSISAHAWRSIEKAPLQEGQDKLDDAAILLDVAMYSMTHALQ